MKKIAAFIVANFMAVLVPVSALALPSTSASLVGDACDNNSLTASDSSLCSADAKDGTINSFLKNIINFLLMLVGILAVIMIIVAAIKYTTSGGDSSKLTSAKNTLLYSIIGLVVAVLSFAIVNFVLDELEPDEESTSSLTEISKIA